MKKFLLSIILVAALLALTVGGLEAFSSYKASEAINKNAPVQTVQTIIIHNSPDSVYKIMTDVNHWAKWHSDIQQPVLKSVFQKGNSFNWKSGGLTICSTIHTAIPGSKIGWSGPAFGCFAIHNWTFTPLPGGYTKVVVEESMEGWLVSLLHKKFQNGLEQSLQLWLKDLKAEGEKKTQ